jgi:L-ornithine Nalpha-acyltransferase
MAALRCAIASSPREVADAQRVRWRVYGDEERLLPPSAEQAGREIDARDDDGSAVHLVIYAGEEPVGTVRLLLPRASGGVPASGRLGLDLEARFDVRTSLADAVVAEVTRFCVVRRFRCTSVAKMLLDGLRAESRHRGITCWLAAANMETDCPEDAALAYRLVRARNMVDPDWSAEPRVSAAPLTPRRRPWYTDDQRRCAAARGHDDGLSLPRTLALFATRMGARYIGPPVFDTDFNVFALPLVASPAWGEALPTT